MYSFKKENLNPKGWKASDCVVRAIAKAEGKSWEEVYKDLCRIGLKKCRMPNEKHTMEALLKEYGWVKMQQPLHSDYSKYTVKDWVISNADKAMIIKVAHHLTYAKDDTLYDTWDCSYKCVGNYWLKGDK